MQSKTLQMHTRSCTILPHEYDFKATSKYLKMLSSLWHDEEEEEKQNKKKKKKKKKKFIYATLNQNIQSTHMLITCAT